MSAVAFGARGAYGGAAAAAAVAQPAQGARLWLWYDRSGWDGAEVTSAEEGGATFTARTDHAHGGSFVETSLALPDDTISLAAAEPPAPPPSVLPPLTALNEADVWKLIGRKQSRAPVLPQPSVPGVGFEARAAGGAGVGLFALEELKQGTVITRYAGALRSLDDFKHSRLYAGERPYPDLNRGTHAARIPGTDWALDAWELAQAAAAGQLRPGDAWATRGLGGLVNSARGDAAGRPQNCALRWHADVCLITTTAPVAAGEELLAGYNW